MQLGLKKTPAKFETKIRIGLPHNHHMTKPDICLFVKDLDKDSRDYEAVSRHYKELLSSKGVPDITEIIPLQQLKKEYQPFEAKRKLSNHCDIFLADVRIIRLLPKLLGKTF